MGGCGLDTSGAGQGQKVGFYEHGNEPWGFIKYGCLDSRGGGPISFCCMEFVAYVIFGLDSCD